MSVPKEEAQEDEERREDVCPADDARYGLAVDRVDGEEAGRRERVA